MLHLLCLTYIILGLFPGCMLSPPEVIPTDDKGERHATADSTATFETEPDAAEIPPEAGPVEGPPREGKVSSAWEGLWAAQVRVPVRWPRNLGFQAGLGHVEYDFFLMRQPCGAAICDSFTLCQMSLPVFKGRFLSERYRTAPGLSLYDRLPSMEVTSYGQQNTLQTPLLPLLLGVRMVNAKQPWPVSAEQLNIFDADADGHPGITFWSDPTCNRPPVNLLLTQRAQAFHAIGRTLLSLTMQLETPDSAIGTAIVPAMDDALAIHTHIIGCLRDDGRPCDRTQTRRLDEALVPYYAAGLGTVVARRLSQNTDVLESPCIAVRKISQLHL